MNCDWQDTGYRRTKTGQRVYACSRFPRCNHVVYTDDPSRAFADCMAPQFALGDGVQSALETFGVTKKRWTWLKQKWNDWMKHGEPARPCACDKRRHWLNQVLTVPLPYVVYLLGVVFGKIQPKPSKIEKLLRDGKIA